MTNGARNFELAKVDVDVDGVVDDVVVDTGIVFDIAIEDDVVVDLAPTATDDFDAIRDVEVVDDDDDATLFDDVDDVVVVVSFELFVGCVVDVVDESN